MAQIKSLCLRLLVALAVMISVRNSGNVRSLLPSIMDSVSTYSTMEWMGASNSTPAAALFEQEENEIRNASLRTPTINRRRNYFAPPASCAILFVGLPRSYESLVLPSIVKNVIPYNPGCDYYVHTYNKTHEAAGRSGKGGGINPEEIFLLRDAVLANHGKGNHDATTNVNVKFLVETEEDFTSARAPVLHRIWNEKDTGGRLIHAVKEFQNGTLQNVVKQWHSISSAWELMEQAEQTRGQNYSAVAVLRSDVVFVTPIQVDENSNNVTVPGFALWPVNDRLIYGNRQAVEIWANQRFSRLDKHVRSISRVYPDVGMHPEKFLNWTIFPAIRKAGYVIKPHPSMCFLRSRPESVLWANDCYRGQWWLRSSNTKDIEMEYKDKNMKALVEQTLGRTCAGAPNWNNKMQEQSCPPKDKSLSKIAVLTAAHSAPSKVHASSCAILFVGLPRSYKSLVLPSIAKNVIPYNPGCDYYVHTYNKTHEAADRSGKGGGIDPTEIFLLKDAVQANRNATSSVSFLVETEENFQMARAPVLHKIFNKKDRSGNLIYFVRKGGFTNTSVQNVVKQWHSISSAWKSMEEGEQTRGLNYTTVAVLRSDVVFVTPIQVDNNVTVPGFALFPESDRLIYGNRPAVEIWANQRFSRLDKHVSSISKVDPSTGIHPESYLSRTIFPAIRKAGYTIKRHPSMCFLRARPENILWANDCYKGNQAHLIPATTTKAIEMEYKNTNMKRLVEKTLEKHCAGTHNWKNTMQELSCPLPAQTNLPPATTRAHEDTLSSAGFG